jgi:hypothetical protein
MDGDEWVGEKLLVASCQLPVAGGVGSVGMRRLSSRGRRLARDWDGPVRGGGCNCGVGLGSEPFALGDARAAKMRRNVRRRRARRTTGPVRRNGKGLCVLCLDRNCMGSNAAKATVFSSGGKDGTRISRRQRGQTGMSAPHNVPSGGARTAGHFGTSTFALLENAGSPKHWVQLRSPAFGT